MWHSFIYDKSGAEGWATIYRIYIYNFLYHSLHVLDGGAHALKGYACMIVRRMQSDRVPSSGNKIYIVYYIISYFYIYIYICSASPLYQGEGDHMTCSSRACRLRVSITWHLPRVFFVVASRGEGGSVDGDDEIGMGRMMRN